MDSQFTPLVSIVIPVYRGGNFLSQAINSALDQTYPNIEVLVINDGSNDEGLTEHIALSYGERIRYFAKPNGGVATALNMAVERMRGDYVSWLSHDDLYTADKVAKQVAYLATLAPEVRARTIVYSDFSIFTDDPATGVDVVCNTLPAEAFRYSITVASGLHGCTLLIPKIAFDEIGGFDPALRCTQDYHLWFRMGAHFSFQYVPGHLVKGRSHGNQDSMKLSDKSKEECNALLNGFVQQLTPQEIMAGTRKSLGVSYAKIAQSMHCREFPEAEKMATRRALTEWPSAPVSEKLEIILVLALGYLKRGVMVHVRQHVTPYRRQQIKRLLRGGIRPAWLLLTVPLRQVGHRALNSLKSWFAAA